MVARHPRLLTLVAVAFVAGCTGMSDFVPCEEDGTIGDIRYSNSKYTLADGTVYAEAGDRPFELCEVANGFIVLNGVIPHFEDFDPFIEIGGFFDAKYDTPDPPFGSGFFGGYVKGFPNLMRITQAVRKTSALLGDGPSDGGFYLEGFDQLEFVEGDFTCGGSENLGSELRVVTGLVGCREDKLTKLEHAGKMYYEGGVLPSLRTLGELSVGGPMPGGRFELPLLEEVGVGYEGAETEYAGDFTFYGGTATTYDLTSLVRVKGQLLVQDFVNVELDGVAPTERGAVFRDSLSQVEVGGRRLICRNGPDDPCPYDEACTSIHGEGAIECCNEAWPTCLDE